MVKRFFDSVLVRLLKKKVASSFSDLFEKKFFYSFGEDEKETKKFLSDSSEQFG